MTRFTISSLFKKRVGLSERTLLCCHYFNYTLKVACFNCQHISLSDVKLFSQQMNYGYLWLSDHRMLVFNVKSVSDVVSVKFSSGSAVQRCCFLPNVAQIFTLKQTHSGCLVTPHSPSSSPSLFILDTLGVAAFNVCVKQSLNLDIKQIYIKKKRKNIRSNIQLSTFVIFIHHIHWVNILNSIEMVCFQWPFSPIWKFPLIFLVKKVCEKRWGCFYFLFWLFMVLDKSQINILQWYHLSKTFKAVQFVKRVLLSDPASCCHSCLKPCCLMRYQPPLYDMQSTHVFCLSKIILMPN